jgi:CRISPR-associated protein Csm2
MKTINEKNYVDLAEKAIQKMKNEVTDKGKSIPLVTTSKIRNLLSMNMDIYNDVVNQTSDNLSDETISRISYLRVRFVYEAGRDASVKVFVQDAQLLEVLSEIGSSKQNYLLFSRYMEALVAFHRYLGGRD